jgi:hypothetical protein
MASLPSRLSLLLALLALFAASCSLWPGWCAEPMPCADCPPALALRVTDGVAGGAVAGVSVVGMEGTCSELDGYTLCSLEGAGPGSYHVEVRAPGYQPHHVTATVPEEMSTSCCSCGYSTQLVKVALTAAP